MRENAGKMRTRITPNTDTFYATYKNYYPVSHENINSFLHTKSVNQFFENYAPPSLKKLTTSSSSVSNQMARFNKPEKKKTINEISTETHF